MWISLSRAVKAWVVLLTLATGVRAETASLLDVQSISLDDAIAKTLASNPELLAFGYQLEAAQGRVQQAGLAPNPELSVAVDDALGTGDFQGIDSVETTISLAWVFERGVREYRVTTAQADASLFGIEAEILRVDVAADSAAVFDRLGELCTSRHGERSGSSCRGDGVCRATSCRGRWHTAS